MKKKPKRVKKTQISVDAFLTELSIRSSISQKTSKGRLIYAMDATASRQPSWNTAAQIQGEMFSVASDLGGLSIQLAFYRGFSQFQVSQWTDNGSKMARLMLSVSCLAGQTQIAKICS